VALDNVVEQLQAPTTRRTVIQTGAKMAYAAPLIAASFKLSASAVGAQAVSGGPNPECAGATCATYDNFPCSTDPDCVCAATSVGGLCVPGSTSCGVVGPCDNGACPDGSVCVYDSCCGSPVCVPLALRCPDLTNSARTQGVRQRTPGSIGG
jgi:hypothetical protein